MRINNKMKVREVAGEHIVIMQGAGSVDMTKVVALNESALLLYNRLRGVEFGLADVVSTMLEVYDVDEATALGDAEVWVSDMRENGLIVD